MYIMCIICIAPQCEGKPRTKWFGEDEEPLTGFSWRGGVERNTTGILMWDKAFPMKLPSGEEVWLVHVFTIQTHPYEN